METLEPNRTRVTIKHGNKDRQVYAQRRKSWEDEHLGSPMRSTCRAEAHGETGRKHTRAAGHRVCVKVPPADWGPRAGALGEACRPH